jgi:uncharacterized membrane protein YfcA
LRHGLGAFLVVYSLYAMLARQRKTVPLRWHAPLAATTGAMGGFCGTLFGGATGPIYAIYLNVLELDKEAFRVTITAVILIGLFARITGYAGLGFYGSSTAFLVLGAVPLMMAGSWLGERMLQRFDQKKFGRCVGCLLLASGVTYLLK